jgi:Bax protein
MKAPWGFLAIVVTALAALALSPLARDIAATAQLQRALGIDVNPLPDFAQYSDVRQKKQAFFEYLQPMVRANNQKLLEERRRLQAMTGTPSSELGFADKRLIRNLAEYYEVDAALPMDKQIQELLLRTDIVPVSLALSQAAMESAWGTSRFAVEGNNLFGQWCYKAGCGIVPSRRGDGRSHEVARFSDVRAAVASYMRNINSHLAYAELRASRAELRSAGAPITGHDMAKHLLRYSERGQDYVSEIQSMIRVNKLSELDTPSANRI